MIFLNVSQGISLKKEDIIGIFDIDYAATSTTTREFLRRSEREGRLINAANDIPKSFALTGGGQVILLRQSAQTLKTHL